jgi:type I restriction enzyme R subunit
MLDTGIDVPEVVNLVFFKLVRSKTKFWQMVGRGTRLCENLFGPGQHKEFFYLFDYCQNLEYFSQNPETTEGAMGQSLAKRLFNARLEFIGEIDKLQAYEKVSDSPGVTTTTYLDPKTNREVRKDAAGLLHKEVTSMNLENFVVRPQRRLVEKYSRPEAWTVLAPEALSELSHGVAGLPSEIDSEGEEAKRFDLLVLNLQLAMLRSEPGFARLRQHVKDIAGLLEEKSSIPMICDQIELILDVQTDEWWQDVTVPMLESVRRRLRELVKLIEKQSRKIIYTDFEDEMGEESRVVLPGVGRPADLAKFKAKARAFLRAHHDFEAIRKLRWNIALAGSDLVALERLLVDSGIGGPEDLDRAKTEAQGLGMFVRSLVGLDQAAAKKALGTFTEGKAFSANQIEFIDMIVNRLTEHGIMEPAALYESPFIDIAPRGPEDLFSNTQCIELKAVLERVGAAATAS